MIRGLYSAASGMIAMERRQEALADNLANAQTPGYKKDDTVLRSFPNFVIQRIKDYNDAAAIPNGSLGQIPGFPVRVGELSNGVYTQERVPSFQQGAVVQTDQPLDIALDDQAIPTRNEGGRQVKPAAFFAVQIPGEGIGYTRNGKWDVDSQGSLVTSDGYKILGRNGQPIQIGTSIARQNINITKDGEIILYPGQPGRTRAGGQIGIAVADNPNNLSRFGANVYRSEAPLQLNGNPGVSLSQGFLEQSNVDTAQTMTDMMMMVRGYEANQKVIGVYDRSFDQLYSVGKLNG